MFLAEFGSHVTLDYSFNGGHDRLAMQLVADELKEFHSKNRRAMIVK
jgi:hypothetical protein